MSPPKGSSIPSASRRRRCSRLAGAPPRGRAAGYTLAEVVISMLISAVMVSSVMSVALTGKQGGGKADRKMIAGEQARRLTQILTDYVSADATAASAALLDVPGEPGTAWAWSGGITDTCNPGPSPCYALKAGSHTLTGFLPGWFSSPPYSGTAVYFVYYSAAGAPPWVNVTINWTDP